MQRFFQGKCNENNKASEWFMHESARMLGKIHKALEGYQKLDIGIGEYFFTEMTAQRALKSYLDSYKKAVSEGRTEIANDLKYRINHLDSLKNINIKINMLTCKNTHGDFKPAQIICKDRYIAAVIDWTSACVHPVSWEIIRSFVYAHPSCENGEITAKMLIEYINEYMSVSPLTYYDLKMMPHILYYQLAVCDYYSQYFNSRVNDYLYQAIFATRLMKWFENNADKLSKELTCNA